MSANFKKTILVIVGVLGIVLIFLFAYEKGVKDKIQEDENTQVEVPEEKIDVSLPMPSGKTSDILDSAIAGVQAEDKLDQAEDRLAENSLDDESEVSAFSNSYEDTNF